jgi:hypothetical protein
VQRCHGAPSTLAIAFFRPSWASEMTSCTPTRPARDEASEEVRPERLGLRRADVQGEDLPQPGVVHAMGDDHALAPHPAAVADLLDLGMEGSAGGLAAAFPRMRERCRSPTPAAGWRRPRIANRPPPEGATDGRRARAQARRRLGASHAWRSRPSAGLFATTPTGRTDGGAADGRSTAESLGRTKSCCENEPADGAPAGRRVTAPACRSLTGWSWSLPRLAWPWPWCWCCGTRS